MQGDNCFIVTVDVAWHPSWLGTERARYFKIDDGILSIISAPAASEISGADNTWRKYLVKGIKRV